VSLCCCEKTGFRLDCWFCALLYLLVVYYVAVEILIGPFFVVIHGALAFGMVIWTAGLETVSGTGTF
jgi:hypothetical protein